MRQHDPEERYMEVYNAIIDYKRDHDGCTPTLRELMGRTSYTSTSTVAYAVRKLEKRGLLRLVMSGKSVTRIEVVGARWLAPIPHDRDDVEDFIATADEMGWC